MADRAPCLALAVLELEPDQPEVALDGQRTAVAGEGQHPCKLAVEKQHHSAWALALGYAELG